MSVFSFLPRAALAAVPMALAAATASYTLNTAGERAAVQHTLSQTEFRSFPVTAVESLTHDTRRYTISLPDGEDGGLRTASVLMVQEEVDGVKVARPYTPTSPTGRRGSLELVVKTYPTGKVSRALGNKSAGDSVELKGPFIKYEYAPNTWRRVGLVAGGTGITPMLQLLREALADPRDTTSFTLVYASRSPEDIILKGEIDALASVHGRGRLDVRYLVDKAPEGWKDGSVGMITREVLAAALPAPTASPAEGEVKIMVCGPPGLVRMLAGEKKSPSDQGELTGALADMGYVKSQVFKY